MDRIVLRYWPKGLGALAALALLVSLLSFHLHDPTFTNLRQPSGGIGNLLGLPGALIGGSLLEALGTAALALPLLLLNWTLVAERRPRLWRYLGWCAALLVAASGLHALAWPLALARTGPYPGLVDPGLAGRALVHWSALTTGPWLAAALLTYLGGYAMPRVVYAPVVGTALRDARVFTGWFLREGWRRWREGVHGLRRGTARAHRVAGAAALGLTRRARLGLGDLLRLVLRPLAITAAALAEWRSPSLGRIKSRADEERQRARTDNGHRPTMAQAFAAPTEDDGFDDWYGASTTGEAPAAAPRAPSAPAPWRRPLRPLEPDDDAPAEPATAAAPASPTPEPEGTEAVPWPRWRKPITPDATPTVTADDSDGDTNGDEGDASETEAGAISADAGGYRFEQPEAEAAWRQRFQRYARNLDLDWEEQLWRRSDAATDNDGDPATPGDESKPDP